MEHNTILVDATTGEVTTEYKEQPIIDDVVIIDYEERVIELIRQRYSVNQELAILRQKEDKPDEYQEYFNYCEECKSLARKESGQDSTL